MKQDNMHLINKIFNNETIRTIWKKMRKKYYISIVDIVSVLVDNKEQKNIGVGLKLNKKKKKIFSCLELLDNSN